MFNGGQASPPLLLLGPSMRELRAPMRPVGTVAKSILHPQSRGFFQGLVCAPESLGIRVAMGPASHARGMHDVSLPSGQRAWRSLPQAFAQVSTSWRAIARPYEQVRPALSAVLVHSGKSAAMYLN